MRRITDVDAYFYYSLLSVGKKEVLKEYLDNEFIRKRLITGCLP